MKLIKLLLLLSIMSTTVFGATLNHHFKFDDLTDEQSATTLTNIDTALTTTGCKYGGCAKFSSSAAVLTFPYNNQDESSAIAFWAKPIKLNYGENQFMVSLRSDSSNYFTSKIEAGDSRYNMKYRWGGKSDSNLITWMYASETLTTNEWKHYVLQFYNDDSCEVWVDGVLDVVDNTCKGFDDMPQPIHFNIGNYAHTNNKRAFQGYIDEVYVFTDTLSASEITSIMNNQYNQDPPQQEVEQVGNTTTITEYICSYNVADWTNEVETKTVVIGGETYYLLKETFIEGLFNVTIN